MQQQNEETQFILLILITTNSKLAFYSSLVLPIR